MKYYLYIVLMFTLVFGTAINHGIASGENNIGLLKIDSILVNQPWDPKDPSWERNHAGATPESIFYIQVDDLYPIKISA